MWPPIGLVEGIAQTIANEIEAEDGQGNGETGEDAEVRGGRDVALGVAQHATPFGRGRLSSKAEKAEGCYQEDGIANTDRRLDDERCQDVREDVSDHDPKITGAEGPGCIDILLPLRRQCGCTSQAGIGGQSDD